MNNDLKFHRMCFHKNESQLSDYHDHFVRELTRKINIDYGRRLKPKDYHLLRRLLETNSIDFSAVLIAYYVNRDSKVSMNQIVDYCAQQKITPENFLWRCINNYVDRVFRYSDENKQSRIQLVQRKPTMVSEISEPVY